MFSAAFETDERDKWPLDRYTYLAGASNLDFVPGLSALTPYNAADASSLGKGEKLSATDASQVNPYANPWLLAASSR